jgi:hypothetical protein
MRILRALPLAAALAIALPEGGTAQTLTFEGLQDQEGIANYYNGGTGSLGSGPGTNHGIYFSANSLACIDVDAGGGCNTANEPTESTSLFFLSGGAAIMNVTGGFTTGFSFFYSSNGAAFVNVYDGLNGTGNLLATLNLVSNFNNNCTGDPNGSYCNWDAVGVAFAGTAMSVDFGGAANFVTFDNVTINSQTPGGVVPEPMSMILLGTGLAGVAGARRRRKQQQELA